MLVRVFGAVFILASCLAYGNQQAGRLSKRVGELEEFRLALRLLMAEIGYTATPLPRALSCLAPRLRRAEVRAFFEAVGDDLQDGGVPDAALAWINAAGRVKPRLNLSEADWSALQRAAAGLGALGRENQVKQLELVETQLAQLAAEAAVSCRDKGKMWRYLGALGGVGLVILLL